MFESMQLLLEVPGAELISSLYLQSFFFPNVMEIWKCFYIFFFTDAELQQPSLKLLCLHEPKQNKKKLSWWPQNAKQKRNKSCMYIWYKNEDRNYIWLCGHLDNFNNEPFLFGFQAM